MELETVAATTKNMKKNSLKLRWQIILTFNIFLLSECPVWMYQYCLGLVQITVRANLPFKENARIVWTLNSFFRWIFDLSKRTYNMPKKIVNQHAQEYKICWCVAKWSMLNCMIFSNRLFYIRTNLHIHAFNEMRQNRKKLNTKDQQIHKNMQIIAYNTAIVFTTLKLFFEIIL